jgi:putative ABC transport system permease protein
MRGTLRWARADLRARRGQALLTIGVVAGVVAALVLATMLLEGAVNPWRGLFARTHGADLVVWFSYGTDTTRLHSLPGIQAVGGTYQVAPATLEQRETKSPVQLTAMGTTRPTMSTPLLVAGTWLRSSQPDGVVVEASFAAAAHVGLGDEISVQSVDANAVRIKVIGIADTADQGFYPQWPPGLIWVQQPVLSAVEPHEGEREYVVDLRLRNTSKVATLQVLQDISNAYNGPTASSAVQRYYTSQQVESSMASDDRLLGLLLALFGIIALVAAPCAIANVTAGRVLMYRQDIAMLKALGFTPGQVVRMLLAEQTGLGIAGALCGVALARVVTSPEFIRPPGGIPVGLAPLPASWVTLIAVGTVLTVAIATAIPAWWAGTVSPVAAVRASPPRGHLSLLARLGLLVHLPAALVLGARDSLTRRLPTLLTVFGVAIPMVMITIALTCWSTIDGFATDPGRIGLAAGLTVRSGSNGRAVEDLADRVGVAYPAASFDTLLPGDNGTFTALAVGSSSGPGRYPFHVVAGTMYRGPDEAVAGQGFLDLMHLHVGDWTSVTIDGVYVNLRITGRILYADNNGDVLAFSLDALRAAGDPQQSAQFYSVVLRPGLPADAARAELLRLSGDRLDVRLVANPADGLGIMRVVIAVSVCVLAVIGLANLLTACAIGLRDHRHEVGVLAAMGLTPRQVMATLVVNTTVLTAAGAALGLGAGMVLAPRLIDMQGQASGMGAGIVAVPSALMVASITGVALVVATFAAVVLARRTLRRSDPAAQFRSPAQPRPRSRPQPEPEPEPEPQPQPQPQPQPDISPFVRSPQPTAEDRGHLPPQNGGVSVHDNLILAAQGAGRSPAAALARGGSRSGPVLVVAGEEVGPFVLGELTAFGTNAGKLAKVLLARRAGREQDEHGGRTAGVVAVGVNAALRHVEEVTFGGGYPGLAVEEADRARGDVERFRERLVEVRAPADHARRHFPLEQAELAVGHLTGSDIPGNGTSAQGTVLDLAGPPVAGRDLADVAGI